MESHCALFANNNLSFTGHSRLDEFLVGSWSWWLPVIRTIMTLIITTYWSYCSSSSVDALTSLFEDPLWRDEPPNPNYRPGLDDPFDSLDHIYTENVPPLHEIIQGLRVIIDSYSNTKYVWAVWHQISLYRWQLIKHEHSHSDLWNLCWIRRVDPLLWLWC